MTGTGRIVAFGGVFVSAAWLISPLFRHETGEIARRPLLPSAKAHSRRPAEASPPSTSCDNGARQASSASLLETLLKLHQAADPGERAKAAASLRAAARNDAEVRRILFALLRDPAETKPGREAAAFILGSLPGTEISTSLAQDLHAAREPWLARALLLAAQALQLAPKFLVCSSWSPCHMLQVYVARIFSAKIFRTSCLRSTVVCLYLSKPVEYFHV